MKTTQGKRILISQPKPADINKSPYKAIIDKHGAKFDFNKFFDVVGISNKDFRSYRVSILDHSAVIFTSRLAVDNYFRLAKELRLCVPDEMKYFCITESIANYLQNYIQYRKRKIFFGKITFDELLEVILKHKEEKFLFPSAEDASTDIYAKLDKHKLKYTQAIMYRSETRDISKEVDVKKFDMVVMFSPIGVKAFIESFPDYNHTKICFAAFGNNTIAALKEAGIKVIVPAPTPTSPSMIMAIDNFLSMSEEEMEEHVKAVDEEFNKKPEKKTRTRKATTKKPTTTKKPAASKKKTTTKKTTKKE